MRLFEYYIFNNDEGIAMTTILIYMLQILEEDILLMSNDDCFLYIGHGTFIDDCFSQPTHFKQLVQERLLDDQRSILMKNNSFLDLLSERATKI